MFDGINLRTRFAVVAFASTVALTAFAPPAAAYGLGSSVMAANSARSAADRKAATGDGAGWTTWTPIGPSNSLNPFSPNPFSRRAAPEPVDPSPNVVDPERTPLKRFNQLGKSFRDYSHRPSPLRPSTFQPLIELMVRHSQVAERANKLIPWVYGSADPVAVQEFEDASERLELAEFYLQQAIATMLDHHNDSLIVEPTIVWAKQEIQDAELMIDLIWQSAIGD